MRGFNKFLFRNKWHVFSFFLKKRVLNFKRSKWKKIKTKILYAIKQYKKYRKRFIRLKFCHFFSNLKFLKVCIKFGQITFNSKYFKFLKKLKLFFLSRKFKKLKRNLKYKLNFYFKKPFYLRYNFFHKCLNLFFFNFNTLRIASKFHLRNRFLFKTILYAKAAILKYYFGCFSLKNFKKFHLSSFFVKDIIKFFVTPELRIDLLLWRLKFFASPFLSKFAFFNNLISINTQCSYNSFLKKKSKYFFKHLLCAGDIITLHPKFQYNYKKNVTLSVSSFFLPSFIEIDYYTNTIILLKNLNLNLKDLNSILKEPLKFYYFRNFIYK